MTNLGLVSLREETNRGKSFMASANFEMVSCGRLTAVGVFTQKKVFFHSENNVDELETLVSNAFCIFLEVEKFLGTSTVLEGVSRVPHKSKP